MNGIVPIVALLMLASNLASPQSPAAEAQRAHQAMTDGNFAEAVKMYSHLSATFPQNLDVKRNLGLALHSAGRYSEALHCFSEILERAPDDKAAILFSGMELVILHRPADAIPLLTKFIRQNQNPVALVARGRAYLAMDQFTPAVDDFSRAAALDSQNAEAWEGLGKAYLMAAQRAFHEVEETGAYSAEWYALLARSSLMAKRYERAFALFREAEMRSPELPGIHAGIAEIYRQTHHEDWAAIEAGKKTKTGPVPSTELRTRYLEGLSFQQRSAEVLNRLERNPDTSEYHALLGLAERIQGRDAESADEFRRALKFSPNSTTLKLELATSLWMSKDCKRAIPFLREMLLAEANSPEAKHLLGECLVDENRPADAIPLLEAALKQDPRLLPAETALGRAYLHAGDYRHAVVHLRKGVTLGDPAVLVQLAGAYRHLGDEKDSAECLKEYKARSAHASQDGEKINSTAITPP